MSSLQQRSAMLEKTKPHITQADLARATKMRPLSVHAWFSGMTKSMKAATAARAAAPYCCNATWEATRLGPIWSSGVKERELLAPEISHAEAEDVVLPKYDIAGGIDSDGKLVLEAEPSGAIKSWRVDREWLRLNVPVYTSLQNLCIVTRFGPSMKHMFNPGNPLLMDRGVTKVDHDGVYFFRVGGEGFIKII